jgi:LAO/AO transport system kinase
VAERPALEDAALAAHERLERVVRGERRALGQLCRALEEVGERELRGQLRARLSEGPRKTTWIVGLTGAPGVGKSTLLGALTTLLRGRGQQVGVLAVDPSSPIAGGALLGDRVRMQQHFADQGVFIHSVASHGAGGGLSSRSEDLVLALSLWGADVVIVETVGVGQAELDVMHLADTLCVVLAPGLGDELQANKAGIMEVADVFAVNKSDLPGAERVVRDVQAMLALADSVTASNFGHRHGAATPATAVERAGSGVEYRPAIVSCVASSGEGLAQLLEALSEHQAWLTTEAGRARRAERSLDAARRQVGAAVLARLQTEFASELQSHVEQVRAGEIDAATAAARLLGR